MQPDLEQIETSYEPILRETYFTEIVDWLIATFSEESAEWIEIHNIFQCLKKAKTIVSHFSEK